MAVRYGPRVVNQPRVPIQITARSLLLVSSGTVRKCEKESMMAKFRKRMVKWGLSAAKVGLAASILVAPAVSAQASEFDGFDGLDFGAHCAAWIGTVLPRVVRGRQAAERVGSSDLGAVSDCGSERVRSSAPCRRSEGRVCDAQRRQCRRHVCVLAERREPDAPGFLYRGRPGGPGSSPSRGGGQ